MPPASLLSRTGAYCTGALTVLQKASGQVVSEDGRKEVIKVMEQTRVNRALSMAERDPSAAFEALAPLVRERAVEDENLPRYLANLAVQTAQATSQEMGSLPCASISAPGLELESASG